MAPIGMIRSGTLASLILISLVGLLLSDVQAQQSSRNVVDGLAHCADDHPLGKGGTHALLARGFNLPNWDPSYTGYKPDDSLLVHLRKEGFSHIRLPVDGEQLMRRFASANGIESFLDALDTEVLRLIGLGYAVSVDMHPKRRFQTLHRENPDLGYAALLEAWDRVAARARDWPVEMVYFELLNEPTPPQTIWWAQAQELVSYLNGRAPGRALVVGPAVFQRHEPLLSANPLVGKDLTYAIHYYDPFLFTHQAMTWRPGSFMEKIGQLPFPGDLKHPAVQKRLAAMWREGDEEAVKAIEQTYAEPWDAARIASVLAPVGAWAERHGVAVIVNEFGVLTFDVDPWARTDWLRAVRQGAEYHCLGWTHWDFSQGFAMVDPKTSLPDLFVLDALIGDHKD